jgi:cofilin
MVESGIRAAESVQIRYETMKLRHDCKYLIFKIVNEAEIQIEAEGELSEGYAEFRAKLPRTEPRFAVFDYTLSYDEVPPRTENKLVFIHWCPDEAAPRLKMCSSSSKEPFKRSLEGVQKEVYATDESEICQENVEATLRRK